MIRRRFDSLPPVVVPFVPPAVGHSFDHHVPTLQPACHQRFVSAGSPFHIESQQIAGSGFGRPCQNVHAGLLPEPQDGHVDLGRREHPVFAVLPDEFERRAGVADAVFVETDNLPDFIQRFFEARLRRDGLHFGGCRSSRFLRCGTDHHLTLQRGRRDFPARPSGKQHDRRHREDRGTKYRESNRLAARRHLFGLHARTGAAIHENRNSGGRPAVY